MNESGDSSGWTEIWQRIQEIIFQTEMNVEYVDCFQLKLEKKIKSLIITFTINIIIICYYLLIVSKLHPTLPFVYVLLGP